MKQLSYLTIQGRKTYHARWFMNGQKGQNEIGEPVAAFTRPACDRALRLLVLRASISLEKRNVFQSTKGILNAVKDIIKKAINFLIFHGLR